MSDTASGPKPEETQSAATEAASEASGSSKPVTKPAEKPAAKPLAESDEKAAPVPDDPAELNAEVERLRAENAELAAAQSPSTFWRNAAGGPADHHRRSAGLARHLGSVAEPHDHGREPVGRHDVATRPERRCAGLRCQVGLRCHLRQRRHRAVRGSGSRHEAATASAAAAHRTDHQCDSELRAGGRHEVHTVAAVRRGVGKDASTHAQGVHRGDLRQVHRGRSPSRGARSPSTSARSSPRSSRR